MGRMGDWERWRLGERVKGRLDVVAIESIKIKDNRQARRFPSIGGVRGGLLFMCNKLNIKLID
jgi:hypothetical protein